MSDGMEFTVPEPVANPLTDADLERLTDESVQFWVESEDYWTLDQATALLSGFYPLDEWEDNFAVKERLLHLHTRRIRAALATEIIKSPQHLNEKRKPYEWLKLMDEHENIKKQVFAPIRAALSKGKAATPQPKTKTKEAIQAYVNERRDNIAQRQWRNYPDARPTKPTKRTVANELLDDIKKEFGKAYIGEGSILRMYLEGWDLPSPE